MDALGRLSTPQGLPPISDLGSNGAVALPFSRVRSRLMAMSWDDTGPKVSTQWVLDGHSHTVYKDRSWNGS